MLEMVDKKPTVWWRYIDDVFVVHVWPHGKNCLEKFVNEINGVHPTIKFTAEWLNEFVTFLDIKVILKEGRIITDLFSKPTDIHQYLH